MGEAARPQLRPGNPGRPRRGRFAPSLTTVAFPRSGATDHPDFGANPRGDVKPRGTEVRRPFALPVLPDRFALFHTRAWAFFPNPLNSRDHPSIATRELTDPGRYEP